MTTVIKLCNGDIYTPPYFDPMVSQHFAAESSHIGRLLEEINDQEIYGPLFKGRSGLTFLDIGANIGLVSIYAYPSCDRIVALEPARQTFDVLRSMTLPFANKIEVVNAALAPADGACVFFENDINTTASSTVNTYGTQVVVRGMTLSSILRIYQLEKVDVMKVDCEGAEGLSLNYEELKAASPMIDALWVEVHNCPASTWEHKLCLIIQHLSILGWSDMEVIGTRLLARKNK